MTFMTLKQRKLLLLAVSNNIASPLADKSRLHLRSTVESDGTRTRSESRNLIFPNFVQLRDSEPNGTKQSTTQHLVDMLRLKPFERVQYTLTDGRQPD